MRTNKLAELIGENGEIPFSILYALLDRELSILVAFATKIVK